MKRLLFVLALIAVLFVGFTALAPQTVEAATAPTTEVVEIAHAPEMPEPKLNLSHVCIKPDGTTEVHFLVIHTPNGVLSYGEVTYRFNGELRTATFEPPQSGGSSHYYDYVNSTDPEVTIDDGTVTLVTTNGPLTLELVNGGTFTISSCIPQEVVLESFGANCIPSPLAVLATWETVTENSVLGFNLFRSETEGDIGTQVNPELIPSNSPGGGQGASYDFTDETIEEGTIYFYYLQSVGFGGDTQTFGPVQVGPCGQPTAVEVSQLDVEQFGYPGEQVRWGLVILALLIVVVIGGVSLTLRRRG
ncbi:MAG: hypothetical protein ACEQSA_00300 [Weeksellaceae bacterium]